MYKTIIEIEVYGDFDMLSRDCIMVSEYNYVVKELVKEYCSSIGISPDDMDTLPDNMVSDATTGFKEFLRKKGFKKLTTKTVCFSG